MKNNNRVKEQWEKKRSMLQKAKELKTSKALSEDNTSEIVNLSIPNSRQKIDRYDEINKVIKELETEKQIIEKDIQIYMKDYELVYIDNRKVTWKTQTRNSIDTKLLKTNYPELVTEYMKTNSYKVFKL